MYNGCDSFDRAAGLLPAALRQRAMSLDRKEKAEAEELRLRIGRPLALTLPDGEQTLPGTEVCGADLEEVVDAATEFSRYTAAESLRLGYLTAPRGVRIGVCGRITADGMTDFSSLSIRIPRPRYGVAAPILPQLVEQGHLLSTLILSPPGGGKTTFLRDLVRLLGDGSEAFPACRVSLVDERGELAGIYRGRPYMDVGRQTDVLSGVRKAQAVPMLLRAMNPQVIALDEVALQEDIAAVLAAAGCGAALLATMHASSVQELLRREISRRLIESGVFRRAVVIGGRGFHRTYEVEELP